jgi:hypothetical protein
MSDSPSPIDRASRVPPTAPADHRRERPAVQDPAAAPAEEAATFDGIPASPPDEVLAEIGEAMGRLEQLRADGVSVAFGDGGRIELVGEDGTRRDIPASELFDVVDGRRPADPPPPAASSPGDGERTPHVDREA